MRYALCSRSDSIHDGKNTREVLSVHRYRKSYCLGKVDINFIEIQVARKELRQSRFAFKIHVDVRLLRPRFDRHLRNDKFIFFLEELLHTEITCNGKDHNGSSHNERYEIDLLCRFLFSSLNRLLNRLWSCPLSRLLSRFLRRTLNSVLRNFLDRSLRLLYHRFPDGLLSLIPDSRDCGSLNLIL